MGEFADCAGALMIGGAAAQERFTGRESNLKKGEIQNEKVNRDGHGSGHGSVSRCLRRRQRRSR